MQDVPNEQTTAMVRRAGGATSQTERRGSGEDLVLLQLLPFGAFAFIALVWHQLATNNDWAIIGLALVPLLPFIFAAVLIAFVLSVLWGMAYVPLGWPLRFVVALLAGLATNGGLVLAVTFYKRTDPSWRWFAGIGNLPAEQQLALVVGINLFAGAILVGDTIQIAKRRIETARLWFRGMDQPQTGSFWRKTVRKRRPPTPGVRRACHSGVRSRPGGQRRMVRRLDAGVRRHSARDRLRSG